MEALVTAALSRVRIYKHGSWKSADDSWSSPKYCCLNTCQNAGLCEHAQTLPFCRVLSYHDALSGCELSQRFSVELTSFTLECVDVPVYWTIALDVIYLSSNLVIFAVHLRRLSELAKIFGEYSQVSGDVNNMFNYFIYTCHMPVVWSLVHKLFESTAHYSNDCLHSEPSCAISRVP